MSLSAALAENMDDGHLIAVAHTEAATVLEHELLTRFEAAVERNAEGAAILETCDAFGLSAQTIDTLCSAHGANPDVIAALLGALSDAGIDDVAELHRILYPATGTPDGRTASPHRPGVTRMSLETALAETTAALNALTAKLDGAAIVTMIDGDENGTAPQPEPQPAKPAKAATKPAKPPKTATPTKAATPAKPAIKGDNGSLPRADPKVPKIGPDGMPKEDLDAAVLEYARQFGNDSALELLGKYGGQKISQVAPADWAALMQDVQAELGGSYTPPAIAGNDEDLT